MPRNIAAALALFGLTITMALPVHGAPAWAYRSLVLPRGDIALDVGLGMGHQPTGPDTSITGFGLNLEIAGGIANDVEMGARVGLRLDWEGQLTGADRYGRPFQTETYGTQIDRISNPELHVRWAVSRGSAFELGMELRAYFPTEEASRFGFMMGVPLSLRGGALRFDTGLYVPVIFYDPVLTVISIPLHLWIQATHNLWLGPLFGVRIINQGRSYTEYPLGFGLGSALTRSIDLRTWLLFPDMNRDRAARTFGAGVALQIRFE